MSVDELPRNTPTQVVAGFVPRDNHRRLDRLLSRSWLSRALHGYKTGYPSLIEEVLTGRVGKPSGKVNWEGGAFLGATGNASKKPCGPLLGPR